MLSLFEYFEMGYDGICNLNVFESEAHPSDYQYMQSRLAEMDNHNKSGLNNLENLGNIFGDLFGGMTAIGSTNYVAEKNYKRNVQICKDAMRTYGGEQLTSILKDVTVFIKQFKAKYI